MFKRMERKLQRKAKEEELGIDEDMKEVLGIHDTDSDESESDSEPDGSSSDAQVLQEVETEAEENMEDMPVLKKRKRGKHENEDEGDELSPDNESVAGQEDEVQLSVQEALNNPLYIVSIHPDIRACILCPGKLLKNVKMVEVHKNSQAHRRRFSRFQEFAVKADPEDDAGDILRRGQEAHSQEPKGSKPSKRAMKRMEKPDKVKKLREMKKLGKARAMAQKQKKAAVSLDSSENPLKKRQKVHDDDSPETKAMSKRKTSSPSSKSSTVTKVSFISKPTKSIEKIRKRI